MKRLLFLLPIFSLILFAQKSLPRFENDTLYTSSGFKIYKGQVLRFSNGTGNLGSFRYIRLANGWNESQKLNNTQCVVKKLNKYNITPLGNAYIFVLAKPNYKDGSTGDIKFNLAFDHAIEGAPGLPSEILVPEEFKHKSRGSVSEEISKLYKLYQDSILSKEEFEIQKKKLLDQ